MHKKHLQNISRTSQYKLDRSTFLRLDANERVIPFKKKVIKDLKNIVSNNILQSYPSEPKNLIKKISKREKISKNYINIVPGSDSAIKFIFENFSGSKLKLVTIYPTYGMIDVYAKVYQLKLEKINENKIESFLLVDKNYKRKALI